MMGEKEEVEERGRRMTRDGRDHNSYRRKHARGDKSLTNEERRFMLNAERGDCATVAKMIESNTVLRDLKYEAHTRTAQQLIRDSTTCCLCMTERRLLI